MVGSFVGEAGVVSQIVDEDKQSMADSSSNKISNEPKLPCGEIVNEVNDCDLKSNEESSEVKGIRIMFHKLLDFRVFIKNQLSSGCMGFVVVHEMELAGVT